MDDLILRFGMLEPLKRQELLDFLDFLLSKQKKERKHIFKDYKEKLLQVSTWSKEDIKNMETEANKLNQWKAPEW